MNCTAVILFAVICLLLYLAGPADARPRDRATAPAEARLLKDFAPDAGCAPERALPRVIRQVPA